MWRSPGWSEPVHLVLVALLMVVNTPDVRAQPEQAQELVERARELFEQGLYVEAADQYGRAFQLDPHPAILYNQARCYQELGDLTRALDLFVQTLTLNPNERIRGEIGVRIDAVRERLVARGFHLSDLDPALLVDVVKLVVTSLPDGAAVTLNGEAVGQTPLDELFVAPGSYQLEVSMPGYQPHRRTLTAEPGRNLSVHAGLRRVEGVPSYQPPAPGAIEVVGPISGMQVFLDGELLGETPLAPTAIPPGQYHIEVRHPAFRDWSARVGVSSGDTTRLVVDAERTAGIGFEETGPPYGDWGIATVIGGSAFLATGIVFGVLAQADADRYHRNVNMPTRDDIRDTALTEALVADLSYGLAAGLLATSLVLFLLERSQGESSWEESPADLVWIETRPGAGGWAFSLGGFLR